MFQISLIIPTYNRAAQLILALESVVLQDLPPAQWECVVVNNNSPDDTAERFDEFVALYPQLNLRMVSELQAGVSYARNCGITSTQTPLMAFIDDDERVNAGFLRAYLEFFEANPQAFVAGGCIIAEYPSGRPAWMSKYVEMPIANPMDFGPLVRPFPVGKLPGGGNMAFRRGVVEAIGGFDPTLGRVNGMLIGGEENDLFERLVWSGQTIWYVPGARMWHIIPPEKLTEGYFLRLCYNVGVSQRLRARIHNRWPRVAMMELLKWGATMLLCLTIKPSQARWLVRMRWQISRGLFLS